MEVKDRRKIQKYTWKPWKSFSFRIWSAIFGQFELTLLHFNCFSFFIYFFIVFVSFLQFFDPLFCCICRSVGLFSLLSVQFRHKSTLLTCIEACITQLISLQIVNFCDVNNSHSDNLHDRESPSTYNRLCATRSCWQVGTETLKVLFPKFAKSVTKYRLLTSFYTS